MPKDHTYCDRHVERVLGTELRNLKREVRHINHVLIDSRDLISKYESIFLTLLRAESIEHHRIDGLFYADDLVAVFLESADCLHGITYMLPRHTIFRTKSRLVDLS